MNVTLGHFGNQATASPSSGTESWLRTTKDFTVGCDIERQMARLLSAEVRVRASGDRPIFYPPCVEKTQASFGEASNFCAAISSGRILPS